MENIKIRLKEVIKEEVAKLKVVFPQKEEWKTGKKSEAEYMDILHDIRDNFNWDSIMKVKNEIASDDYDDFIYDELSKEFTKLL